MRVSASLAFLLVAAAAPLSAQRAAPVRHGDGYEIALPTRFEAAPPQSETRNGGRMQTFAFVADEQGEGVVVLHVRFTMTDDTTFATRRAMLQLARVGMLQAAGEVTPQGEPREFERGDRVGLRIPIRIEQGETCGCDGPGYGVAELSVAREGGPEMWMVMYVGTHGGPAASSAAGERMLDTFRLTAAQEAAEGDEAVRGRGFVELTDIKAKPRP